jgi:hypothetical protein
MNRFRLANLWMKFIDIHDTMEIADVINPAYNFETSE